MIWVRGGESNARVAEVDAVLDAVVGVFEPMHAGHGDVGCGNAELS